MGLALPADQHLKLAQHSGIIACAELRQMLLQVPAVLYLLQLISSHRHVSAGVIQRTSTLHTRKLPETGASLTPMLPTGSCADPLRGDLTFF